MNAESTRSDPCQAPRATADNTSEDPRVPSIGFKTARARARTYASSGFARDIAEILQRPRSKVHLYAQSLIDSGLLPVAAAPEAVAVAVEGARILAAAASRQIRPASVVRVTKRILAMEHEGDLAEMGTAAERSVEEASGETFEVQLAHALREIWEATERPSSPLPVPPNVTVTWNDGGTVLYGTIGIASKVTSVYSSFRIGQIFAFPGKWRSDAVGGACFSSFAVLGIAEHIRDAVRTDGCREDRA